MQSFLISLFILALTVDAQSEGGTPAGNGTVLDNLNNNPRLRLLSLVLRTYCGQAMREQLNNRTANLTFFAPSDQAIARTFDLRGIRSADDFACPNVPGGNLTALSAGCNPLAIRGGSDGDKGVNASDRGGIAFKQASPCIPLLLQYHLVPDQRLFLNSTSSSNSTGNVTSLRTALNDTRFVQLSSVNQTMSSNSTDHIDTAFQALLLNQTANGTASLYHGAWQPAQILTNETISGINGVVYFIDNVLLPPANLTESLSMRPDTNQFLTALNQTLNSTSNESSSSNGNSTASMSNFTIAGWPLQNVTIFAPQDSAFNSSQFNITSYIIPNHVHLFTTGNNTEGNHTSTGSYSMNMTNIQGQAILAQWDASGNATVNGVQVVEPNILISEGVLHLINGTLSANQTSTSNSTTAQAAWSFGKRRK